MKQRRKEKFDTKIKSGWFLPDDPFEFVSLQYQRAVTQGHVNKIRKSLEKLESTEEGAHFTEPLVVNIRDNKKVALLDGYHRWEGMIKYGKNVKIKLEIYEGLTPQQEKKIYEDYNIGKSHTVLDLIRPRVKQNKALKHLLENSKIPLTLYSNKKKGLSIATLISCYKKSLWETEKKRYHQPMATFILEYFNEKDAEILANWTGWYTSTVGDYHHKSDYYSVSFMSVCFYIYRNTLRTELLQKRLENFVFDSYFKQILSTSGGFSGFKLALKETKDRINKGLKIKII